MDQRRAAVVGPRTFRFAFGEVEIEHAERFCPPAQMPVFATWPCRGCGQRRLVDDAWLLTVCDVPSRRNSRPVLVCAGCAVRAGYRLRSGDNPLVTSPSGEVGATFVS